MIRRSKVAKTSSVKITFSLPQDNPDGPVSVVGDFNDWTPGSHPLVKRTNGTRSVAITVPAGHELRFRYLGTDGHWFDDPDADRIEAGACVLQL